MEEKIIPNMSSILAKKMFGTHNEEMKKEKLAIRDSRGRNVNKM